MTIYVIGPRDKVPEGAKLVDVTTRGKSLFSPMYNSCNEPIKAQRMENAWQYSKVYKEHIDIGNGYPNHEWLTWRSKGLKSPWADRYPMGKGRKPLYSYAKVQGEWQKLDYIEARKHLYTPLYKDMLQNIQLELNKLVNLCKMIDVALWDYDGYLTNDSFDTIINNPNKKMGHAFVLREVIKERLENE